MNCEGMAIRMHFFGKILPEIFPAVIGHQQCEFEQVNTLIVYRIDPDLAEIKRARIDRAHPRPFFAAVFRSKHAAALAAQIGQLARAAFITLHDRHHDFRIARADRETDAAGLSGQAAAQFFPTGAAVRAFKNSADIFAAGDARARM